MEMNPLILVNGEAYPVDIGELDDTIAFKYLKKWSSLEFPLPFGRVMSLFQKGYIYELDEKLLEFTEPQAKEEGANEKDEDPNESKKWTSAHSSCTHMMF
ncbi:ATP-citrate synthase alpha chain protein 2-like isoform X1 [Lolium rigidum]|uniref:ATP-citrate synthase alpha chain protein 2-like isoform X1 n=1 Tax=Lolium rigidum TaxID=89674 RepID=UPI001F5C1063|nr:ATP-citrate synthase alpha chain protein 2-like isoform X1 [Lolium rigidum]